MAFTETDLANLEAAMVALTTGERKVEVRFSSGNVVRYAEADLDQMQRLRTIIQAEVGSGYTRTYAKQGGRASC